MKKIIFFYLVLVSVAAKSQNRQFSAGLMLGSPTAIVAKYGIQSNAAVQGGLAFSANDYFLGFVDYIQYYPEWIPQRSGLSAQFRPYLGVGGILAIASGNRDRNDRFLGTKSGSLGLGARIPVGIEWRTLRPPVGVFFELAPGVSLVPATEFLLQVGLGARYYF